MEMIVKGRLAVLMMTVMSVSMLILLVSMVVEADDNPVQYLSPLPPYSWIFCSLSSNSSEDNLKKFILTKIIEGTIFQSMEKKVFALSFNQRNTIGSGKALSSKTPIEKIGPMSTYTPYSGEEKSKLSNDSNHVIATYGFHMIKANETTQPMCDYVIADTIKIGEHEVGLFAIFDGFNSNKIPAYLQSTLFNNIITQPSFLSDTRVAVREGYRITDTSIQENPELDGFNGLAASTAVTTILMKLQGQSNYTLVIANVGHSRAIICCKNGEARQLSIDHVLENEKERKSIIEKGACVRSGPGGTRLSGMFSLSRAFGVKAYKKYMSFEPHVVVEMIDDETEFLVLVSHPVLYMKMSNQQAVDSIRQIKNPQEAAENLTRQAIALGGKTYGDHTDDLSCVVVRFQGINK